MQEKTFTFEDHDGIEIFVYNWRPDPGTEPKAVVQIAHGMAEHAGRYARPAEALTRAGYVVYANDHRGHGKTAGSLDKVGQLGPDGWNGMVKDAKMLTDIIKEENPGLPVFLLGHSMGSFITQNYIQNWGSELKGAILSGTNGKQPVIGVATWIAKKQVKKHGPDTPNEMLNKLSFGKFNKAFEPARTEFDWLSRDDEEVKKYIDDPFCGWVAPSQFFVELLKGLKTIWNKENEARIPKDLPIYLFSGSKDPVSNQTKGVLKLIDRYKKLGIKDIKWKFYPNGRHEMFNETNRDKVVQDLIAWLGAHL
ncbi:MAG: lysophospholipase [Promethearchaeota archaeon]